MADSTGPVLAIGAITIVNNVVVGGKPFDWRVPVATGVSAAMLAFLEKGWRNGAVMLAYVGLVTVLFVRVDPGVPSPIESFNTWFSKG